MKGRSVRECDDRVGVAMCRVEGRMEGSCGCGHVPG